jgi:hypothetical protein
MITYQGARTQIHTNTSMYGFVSKWQILILPPILRHTHTLVYNITFITCGFSECKLWTANCKHHHHHHHDHRHHIHVIHIHIYIYIIYIYIFSYNCNYIYNHIYIYWECVKVYIEYTCTRFCLRGFYSTEYCAILHNTAHLLYPWCLWSTSFHPQSGHTLRFWLWMDRINGWCDVWGAVPKCGKHQKLFDILHDSVNMYIYIYCIYIIMKYIMIYMYEQISSKCK